MNQVLRLHCRRLTIAQIAERTGLTAAEVTRIIVANRERRARPVYEPSVEEIYAEAARIRPSDRYPVGPSDRYLVGHPPQSAEIPEGVSLSNPNPRQRR